MAFTKTCLVLTGVTRPSSSRVLKNIKETIKAVDKHNADVFVMTYKTPEAEELSSLVASDPGLEFIVHQIEVFKDPPGGYDGKNYMMFRMIEMLVEKIPNFDSYDCIVRHRLDCSLESIQIPDKLEKKALYAAPGLSQKCFDNICLARPFEFKSIFNTNTAEVIDAGCPHEALERAADLNKYDVVPFNFKQALYQSNEDFVLGAPQWSKRDRVFEYKDGWLQH
jgi:hypothetical protein